MSADIPSKQTGNYSYEQTDWMAIPAGLMAGEDNQHLTRRQLKTWPLVLAAKQVPYRSERAPSSHWELHVPAPYYLLACRELQHYEEENRNWPPPAISIETTENTTITLWLLILLALFHNLTTHQIHFSIFQNVDWFSAGNADAQKILAGQWWRTITSLTLHSGPLHLTGNIIFGGIIITRLAHLLRSGPAWLLTIVSAALANFLNALAHGQQHHSIGFSTAVFSALAILCVSTMKLQTRRSWRRWLLPLMAGCALLALLGTSGEQTDLGAHLFGFLSGLACAAIGLKTKIPGQLTAHLNAALGLVTAVMVVGSWILALNLFNL